MSARATGAIKAVLGLAVALSCAAVAVASSATPASKGVLNVRFGGDSSETRVVMELDQSTKGEVLADGAPGGVVSIALSGVAASADLQGRGQGLVAGWSMDNTAGAARLRLQLTHAAHVRRRFELAPADGVSVYRYVIDLVSDDPAPAAAKLRPAETASTQPELQLQPQAILTSARLRLKKTIVIDAGHGGKDPGAIGQTSREKDVNLAAARALKAALEATGRYRVVMTRDSDVFVPLETRVQIARRAQADLFISLHSDSGPRSDERGATVYTLSDRGSDRVERNVMAQSDWFINVDLPGRDRAVNQILLDLTQRATRNRSAAFAEDLLGHIGDRVETQRRNHRDAGFVVLLAPDVPAVLLEMGFITNDKDEALLNSAGQRERFMNAVAQSIDSYFGRQTQIAAR